MIINKKIEDLSLKKLVKKFWKRCISSFLIKNEFNNV